MLFNKKSNSFPEYYKTYLELKKEFVKYIKELLSGLYMPKKLVPISHEIYMKAISCVFSIFNSSDSLLTLQVFLIICYQKKKEEFSELVHSIDICTKHHDLVKQPEILNSLVQHIFDSLLFATEKTQAYLEEVRKMKNSIFTPESQIFLPFTEITIQALFDICVNPVFANNEKIWEKMSFLCQNQLSTQILILVWQRTIFDVTSVLSDCMQNINEEDFKIFSDISITPFEKLTFCREYALQVVFDALSHIKNVHDFGTDCYTAVYKTNLYKEFSLWMKLLKLINFGKEFTNKQILIEYIRSIFHLFIKQKSNTWYCGYDSTF